MSQDYNMKALDVEVSEQGVATVWLNRPGALNSLDGTLVQELGEVFEAMDYDAEVRVVILGARGEKAFCVGADLKERESMDEEAVSRRIDDYRRVFRKVERISKPTIAAVDGYAFGGGLELAMACDLRVMGQGAKVGLTELRLGIIPGAGGTQRLTRLVGAARAKELIFRAARISGERAADMGLANVAVGDGEAMAKSHEWAEDMLASAPIALAQAKRAIDAGADVDLETGLDIEAAAYAVTIPTEDRKEGLKAFKEKRKPEYKGR